MNILDAIALGAVEGITEFLPVSSTGHLTILEKILGYSVNDPDITAFTAIIQSGAVMATLIYFRRDLRRLITAWFRGVLRPEHRSNIDYRLAWAVILGSLPIGFVGIALKDQVETTFRSLWFVGSALLLWSGVMWFTDRHAAQTRGETNITWRDTLFIGAAQSLALIPGVSRSGATMSAGLFRDFDRVTVTRLSFFLSIPALLAAAVLQTWDEHQNISKGVGWPATITATIVSFVVAYFAVAWLLKYVAGHDYFRFIVYRVVVGVTLLVLVGTGVISAT